MAFDETPSLPKQKRRRVEPSKGLINIESLWTSVAKNLDILYQDQERHQRITTSITGQIEIQNRTLVSEFRELLDSQKCRLLEECFHDRDNEARTLVGSLVEDLQAQQRRLFEEGFKDTEQLVRTLVADLVEEMSAQQRRVIDMKRFIQQYQSMEADCDPFSTPDRTCPAVSFSALVCKSGVNLGLSYP